MCDEDVVTSLGQHTAAILGETLAHGLTNTFMYMCIHHFVTLGPIIVVQVCGKKIHSTLLFNWVELFYSFRPSFFRLVLVHVVLGSGLQTELRLKAVLIYSRRPSKKVHHDSIIRTLMAALLKYPCTWLVQREGGCSEPSPVSEHIFTVYRM